VNGIVGFVYFDGRRADRRDLVRMSSASSHRASDGEAGWVEGAAALGRQSMVSESAAIAFDGRLDCIAGVRWQVAGCSSSDALLGVAAYEELGAACAGRMTGDFAFALFDRRAQRLILARDLMASRPLFYCALPHGVAFASEMKSLLAHPDVPCRPDEDGLADLVLNGYYDGARTWLDGVRSVPPGTVVIASAGRLTVERVADFDHEEIRYSSGQQYVEHFGALFTQAVRRRLRSAHPVAVSVSGGVDSSAIYCEAARLDVAPVHGFTLAFPCGTAADEHEFIAALRARSHRVDDIPVDDVRLVTDADSGVARTEMPRLPWACQDDLLARAREAGCRVVLDGFFADQMLAGRSYLVDLARAGRWMTVRRHLREYPRWMTDVDRRVFARSFANAAARAAAPSWLMFTATRALGRARAARRYPAWFSASFRERAYQRALDRARAPRRFRSEHREQSWRCLTSGNYLASILQAHNSAAALGMEVAYPFRDRDLVTFLANVPGDVITRDGVPKALLRDATIGVLPDAIRLRRWKGDGTSFSNRASRLALEALSQSLERDSLSARAGLVDIDALRSHVNGPLRQALAGNDSAHPGWQVADTLALELWMRRFCGTHHAAHA